MSPARSYQLEVQDQIKIKKIVYVFPKKVIQKSVRLIWSIEKVKCETNRCNNQAKLTRYASCTSSWEDFFKPPEITGWGYKTVEISSWGSFQTVALGQGHYSGDTIHNCCLPLQV